MTLSKTWLIFPVSYFLLRFFKKFFKPYIIYLLEKAFEVKLEDNMAFLPGVVSRKKQVVPVIDKNI